MKPVGIIGFGVMGSAAGRQILEAGYPLCVFEVAQPAIDRAVTMGAAMAASPAELAIACPVVLMFLPGPRHVVDCVSGEDGLLYSASPGCVIVDHSKVDPGTTQAMAYGDVEGTRFMYSVADIECQAALSDVVAGFTLFQQTRDPAFAKRMRELNPNIVLLPYRIAGEAGFEDPDWGRQDSGVEIEEDYMSGIADEWIVKTADGRDAGDLAWTFIKKLNIYDSCPVVEGLTFNGIFAPKTTPKPVVDRLSEIIRTALTKQAAVDQLAALGSQARGSTPEQFTDFLRAETKKWGELVKAADIKSSE